MALTCEASRIPVIVLLLGTSDIATARLVVTDRTTATKATAVTLMQPIADGCLSADQCHISAFSGLIGLEADELPCSAWPAGHGTGWWEEGNEQTYMMLLN